MSQLFESGIRPAIDAYLEEKAQEVRDYGSYWSASSAGYCMRKLMFERLGVPPVKKLGDERKTRVFEVGHIFHEWMQGITKGAGLSIAQELELQDEKLMVRGHIDDLVLIKAPKLKVGESKPGAKNLNPYDVKWPQDRLILYDYKTQHANAFTWQKGRAPSHYHKMQAGTYMYMLRNGSKELKTLLNTWGPEIEELSEARILKISKDDLRMDENQILYTPALEKEVVGYWSTLNGYWKARTLPACTCSDKEGGFMSREIFNPFFYDGKPCSLKWYAEWKKGAKV
jgi:hypothetical protein